MLELQRAEERLAEAKAKRDAYAMALVDQGIQTQTAATMLGMSFSSLYALLRKRREDAQ